MSKRPVFQNPQLDGSTFQMDGSRTGVLLLHGFTATTVEVQPMARYLNQMGYRIAAPLLPGHGTAPEAMLTVSWKDWVNCAENAYQSLAANVDKLFVAGESMGGLLSLYLASRHPEIPGILLYAPALKIPGLWKARLLYPFVKIMPKGYVDEENAQDTEVLPWQGYTVVALPAVRQLGILQGKVRRALPQIRQPLLIFQGDLDHTIDPLSSKLVFDSIGSVDKEYIRLEQSGHCILLDRELKAVEGKTAHFLQRLS